jgi:outer membrane lipoprotein carrier protein
MIMIKKYSMATVAFVLLFTSFNSSAQKFEFVTVSDVVRNIKDRFSKVEGYQADFTMVTVKGSGSVTQKGVIQSLRPNFLRVTFHSPKRQQIVSDGKMMWIHIPSMNVVAEQDLKGDRGTEFSATSYIGLRRLFAKYHYKFASKEQPALMSDGKKYYTLFLQQKESRSGYKTINLWVNEDFLITRAEGETSIGKKITISFDNINTNVKLLKGQFKFDIPSNARVIKNPMISEE